VVKAFKYRTLIYYFSALVFIALCGFEPADVVRDQCGRQKAVAADCTGFMAEGAGEARNVILFIGDGMGTNQVYAGRVYLNGPDAPLSWEEFPHTGLATTCAVGGITDSAAAGTAIATGHKTRVGQVSTGPTLEYEKFESILERVKDRKATGLVSTTSLWDATPAVFAAHASRRTQSRNIAQQMVEETRVDVMLGGGAKAFIGDGKGTDVTAKARELGYVVVRDADELNAVNASETKKLLGLFNDGSMTYEKNRGTNNTEPHLSDMVGAALDVLDNDPRGLFLMVEGARIDHSSHAMSMDRLVLEMAEFDKSINIALEWAKGHPDTLILITADHETGGIEVRPGDYKKGDKLKVRWTTAFLGLHANHSSQRVPVYGHGPNAGAIREHMDNTEVYCIMRNAFGEQ
jgi:alkaline phosphatase